MVKYIKYKMGNFDFNLYILRYRNNFIIWIKFDKYIIKIFFIVEEKIYFWNFNIIYLLFLIYRI